MLEQQGGAHFFGEPALNIKDLMRTTPDGRGYISILAAQTLMELAAALRDVPVCSCCRSCSR